MTRSGGDFTRAHWPGILALRPPALPNDLPTVLQPHQIEFLDTAIDCGALTFGRFTLKSGRISPYFFNAGRFDSGRTLDILGRCYAHALPSSGLEFDLLFGPAYKGLPLATALALALHRDNGMDIPVAFNRKEAKGHGEGGVLIGAPVSGRRVLIVDDVITAGTAIREAATLITQAGGHPSGVLIALDRQERGRGAGSAVMEVQEELGLPVIAVARLDDLLAYAAGRKELAGQHQALADYRQQHGV